MSDGEPQNEPSSSKPHDLLALLGSFARDQGIALTDGALVPRFLADAGIKLENALSDSALIHGTRTEQQFEALVVTLGAYRLIKAEDQGRIHARSDCRVPDYRVVLDDGEQWLIEVKNVRQDDPFHQVLGLSASYLASLYAYCDLVGLPLRIAIYWSTWKIWTLVDPNKFQTAGGGARIEMKAAMAASELSRLGDMLFFTEPPIRLLVEGDSTPLDVTSGETSASVRFGAARLFVGGKEIVDKKCQQLAWILMLYGEWIADGPHAVMADGRLAGIEFIVAPEDTEQEEPAFMGRAIGQASRVFARYFADDTTAEDAVIQLRGLPKPEWFELIVGWDFETAELPLWILRIQPNGGAQGTPSET